MLYYMLTTGAGKQTLGEEYCDITQVEWIYVCRFYLVSKCLEPFGLSPVRGFVFTHVHYSLPSSLCCWINSICKLREKKRLLKVVVPNLPTKLREKERLLKLHQQILLFFSAEVSMFELQFGITGCRTIWTFPNTCKTCSFYFLSVSCSVYCRKSQVHLHFSETSFKDFRPLTSPCNNYLLLYGFADPQSLLPFICLWFTFFQF